MTRAATLPRLEVRYVTQPRRGFAVFRDGQIEGGLSTSRDMAEEKLTALKNRLHRSGKIMRPCLCCRAAFLSEGRHNRMCDRCRQAANDSAMC